MRKLANIRADSFDTDTGSFDMTLATEGEASDGDILEIKGGEGPDKFPLLSGHVNDATTQLGSITEPRKRLRDKPPSLVARGQIELEGDGAPAEIRRDLALMIEKGHVSQVSIRWDMVESVRRVNLPSDHPYFVDEQTEKDWRKRYGLLHTKWRWMEGSIVGLGADPLALIRCADAADTARARGYWRRLAFEAAGVTGNSSEEPAAEQTRPWEIGLAGALKRAGVAVAALGEEDEDHTLMTVGGDSFFLPSELAARIKKERAAWKERIRALKSRTARVRAGAAGGPGPRREDGGRSVVEELVEEFHELMEGSDRRMDAAVRDMVDTARGRVKR